MKNFIKRIRRTLLPPLPRTFTELGEALENYDPARNIYKGIFNRGGASAVIFASNEMLASLKRARWLESSQEFRYPRIICRGLCLHICGPWKTSELELLVNIGIFIDY